MKKEIRDEFQTVTLGVRSGSPVKSGRFENRQKKSCLDASGSVAELLVTFLDLVVVAHLWSRLATPTRPLWKTAPNPVTRLRRLVAYWSLCDKVSQWICFDWSWAVEKGDGKGLNIGVLGNFRHGRKLQSHRPLRMLRSAVAAFWRTGQNYDCHDDARPASPF
jgi:hypothetical protein